MGKILVTGGAGYIGSHTVVRLLENGYSVLILDNLANSNREVLNRIERITGTRPELVEGDIRDAALLERLFSEYAVDAVMHFAGLKAVGESVSQPLAYYDCNVVGSLRLMQAMDRGGVRTLVFSSSATVYGDPDTVPISEDCPLKATNPYGTSKLHIEDMLRDLYYADDQWHIGILRYFNPVGAHESGLIGEDPAGIPNNLMPFIAQVAVGKREAVQVFGNDYPTADGTGVRDYIHVIDLAEGHLAALRVLRERGGLITTNLGTGRGYSVLEVIEAFGKACGRKLPYRITERRAGDSAICYADPSHAARTIGWRAKRGIEAMCADHWRWQSKNPNGYR